MILSGLHRIPSSQTHIHIVLRANTETIVLQSCGDRLQSPFPILAQSFALLPAHRHHPLGCCRVWVDEAVDIKMVFLLSSELVADGPFMMAPVFLKQRDFAQIAIQRAVLKKARTALWARAMIYLKLGKRHFDHFLLICTCLVGFFDFADSFQ